MIIHINRSTWTLLVLSSLLSVGTLSAQQSAAPADNATVNQRDRNPNEPTADLQKTTHPTATSRSRFDGPL
jgi:hypothetical protein